MLIPPRINAALGPMDQGRVRTDDGVELLYQAFGPKDAKVIVFANGIGVRYPAAVRQIEALRDEYRVLCWDYRGMGQSLVPAIEQADYSMQRQARDLLAILDALGVEQAVFVGWSMGVQVGLEVARLAAARMAGFVALLGTYKQPFRTAFPAPIGESIERAFDFMRYYPVMAQRLLDLAVALPTLAHQVLQAAWFIAPEVDREVFSCNIQMIAGVEKRAYLRTMMALAEHDAEDVLASIRCPTLVICGGRDFLTPPRVAQHMARSIVGARYRELPGASHFGLIEHPSLVNEWLADLAREAFAGG